MLELPNESCRICARTLDLLGIKGMVIGSMGGGIGAGLLASKLLRQSISQGLGTGMGTARERVHMCIFPCMHARARVCVHDVCVARESESVWGSRERVHAYGFGRGGGF